jgi:hypothetical protein
LRIVTIVPVCAVLSVSLGQQNVVQVRGGQQQSPYIEELNAAMEAAEQNGVGLFTKVEGDWDRTERI